MMAAKIFTSALLGGAIACGLSMGIAKALQAAKPDGKVEPAQAMVAPSEKQSSEGLPPAAPALGRAAFQAILKREAERAGLPIDIGDAVMSVESGYDPNVIGGAGEIGLMQVRPATAGMMGFGGTVEELAKPEVNIHFGVVYLAKAWHLADGDLCRALMKYRAGHGEEEMTPLSVSYCSRARAHLQAVNSPFAAVSPAALPADAGSITPVAIEPHAHIRASGTHAATGRFRTAATSRAFWAAEEARVKAISARLEAKWHRVAALR